MAKSADQEARDRQADEAEALRAKQAAAKAEAEDVEQGPAQAEQGPASPAATAPLDLTLIGGLIAETLKQDRAARTAVPPPTAGLDESPVPGGIGLTVDGRITDAHGKEIKTDELDPEGKQHFQMVSMQARRQRGRAGGTAQRPGSRETDAEESETLQVGA